jgi:hypothetical protein
MVKAKGILIKGAHLAAYLAGATAKKSERVTCGSFYHQPKAPNNLREFCKK